MSNMNIQQKVSLIKSKETKVKESSLSDEQLRINDYTDNIKPSLTEDQIGLIQKYQTKLSVLGEYKEVNIYDMVRKYDWNVKVLDDLTSVMIKKWEEAKNANDWTEVKRVAKPVVTKKAKEAEDVKRSRRNEGEEDDTRDKSRNYKGGRGNFKERARRGQSMDPNQGGYGSRYDQYEDYNAGEGHQDGGRRFREDNRLRKKDKGQREVVMYVKKGEQDTGAQGSSDVQTGRRPSEDFNRRGRFDRERVVYVKKNKETIGEGQETASGRAPQNNRGRGRQQARREEKEDPENVEESGWQNEDSSDEKDMVTKPKENKPVAKVEEKPQPVGREHNRRGNNAGTGVIYVKKETQGQGNQQKQQESLSPVRHYNEHNIHEFFQIKDNNEGKESAKKSVRREPGDEVAHPKEPARPEAEKPVTENVEKPKQRESHDQPIGPNRSQNSQTAAHTTQQQTAQNTVPSPQTTPQQNIHPAQSPQSTSATTQSPHGENFTNDPSKQQQNAAQYMPQAFGFPQYPQQPYFMPQFPQQPMFNPYMAFPMPQAQPQGTFNKEHPQQQAQPQASYPPGFNPQDMSSMFQVQYMLIPQPNGPPILQPIFPMMPQVMGMGVQRPGEGEQQKYPQSYYPFPVNMPNTPPEFYGADDKKSRHPAFENKQSATPNTGSFFNFSSNDSEHKKHQSSYMPQQGGYQFMPYMMPPMQGAYPGQQHQGKQGDGTGNSGLKTDFLFPNH